MKNLNSIVFIITLLFFLNIGTNYNNKIELSSGITSVDIKTPTNKDVIGNFKPDNNGNGCYLSSAKNLINNLKHSVDSFKNHIKDDEHNLESYELIKFEQNFSELELKMFNKQLLNSKSNKDVDLRKEVYKFMNDNSKFIEEYPQLRVIYSIAMNVNPINEIQYNKFKETADYVRLIYHVIADKIKDNELRPFYYSADLAKVAKYEGLINLLEHSNINQNGCLDKGIISYFDEIHQDLNSETVSFCKVNNNIFQVTRSELYFSAVHYSFWMKLSIPSLLNNNTDNTTNVFNYQANSNKISIDLRVNFEDNSKNIATIEIILNLNNIKKLVIKNNAPCSDLAFVTFSFYKNFDSYILKLIVKSTYENNRKAVQVAIPASYVEFGTFTFTNNSDIVNMTDIYKVNYNRPNYCSDKDDETSMHISQLQELELITQIPSFEIKNYQDYLTTQCSNIPENCLYYFNNKCLICKESFYSFNGLCYSQCPTGTYYNPNSSSLIKVCNLCDSNCKTCYDKSDKCSSCSTNLYLYNNKCDVSCPSNTWPISGYCISCGSDCEICSDKDKCERCKLNYLHEEKCIENCPIGYYKATNANNNSKICAKCNDNCSDCSNYNQCNKCKEDHFLFYGICLKGKCPTGFFGNLNTYNCDRCPTECSECVNSSLCTACTSGYNLFKPSYKCITDCPYGYVSINGVCVKCSGKNCAKCSALDTTICTECGSEYFLKNNRCELDCGDGYYPVEYYNEESNSNLSYCLPCNSGNNFYNNNCKKCVDNKSCILCNSNYFNYKGFCLTTCPDGYIGIGTECVLCNPDSNCKNCSERNTDICLNCFEGHFLYAGRCYEECPQGTYQEGKLCMDCNPNCKTCSNKYTCDICRNSSLYLKNGECVKDCGIGYRNVILDISSVFNPKNENNQVIYDKVCVPCQGNNCGICSKSIDECVECINNWGLLGTVCVQNCVPGTYKSKNNICKTCNDNCIRCENNIVEYNNTSYDNVYCIECDEDHVLSPNKRECLTSCPDFYTNVDGECISCADKNCKQCAADTKTCLACSNDMYLFNKECLEKCPSGYVEHDLKDNNNQITSKICIPCEAPCNNCYKKSDFCLDCIENYALLPNNTCTDRCPLKTANVNNVCLRCQDYNCLFCGKDLSTCYLCNNNYFLYNKTCYRGCPTGYFADSKTKTCVKCFDNCSTCTSEDKCLMCSEGYKLFNNICTKECPLYYTSVNNYSNSSYNGEVCMSCTEACLNCSSKINTSSISSTIINQTKNNQNDFVCFNCEDNYFLHEGKCHSNCPVGYYHDYKNKICSKCNVKNCAYCNVNTDTCSLCQNGLLLLNNNCVNSCPIGYRIKDNYICEKCNVENCDNCDSNIDVCSKCTNKFYKLSDTKCSPTCPPSTFPVSGSQFCYVCDIKCSACIDSNRCLACKDGYFLKHSNKDNTSLNFSIGNCVENCGIGYTANSYTRRCEKCNDNCSFCNIDVNGNKKCLACESGYYLFENTCINKCPEGYFNSELNRKCEPCNPICKTCSNENSCLSCSNEMVLHESTCIDDCPNTFVKINNKCVKCQTSSLCNKCNPNDLSKCIDCGTGIVYDGRCITGCPAAYTTMNKSCFNCPEHCSFCETPGICSSCLCPYALLPNGQCSENCPSGFVKINTALKSKSSSSLVVNNSYNSFYNYNSNYNLVCERCSDDNCAICSVSKQCKKCNNGYNLKMIEYNSPNYYNSYNSVDIFNNNLSNFQFTCVVDCGEGSYAKDGNCVNCKVSNCDKCSNSYNCTICSSGYSLFNNICVKNCPENYFSVSMNNNNPNTSKVCSKCIDYNCQNCSSQNPNICFDCKNDLILYNNKCYNDCPEGLTKINNKCIPCNSNCLRCSLSDNSNINCNLCQSGYYLKNINGRDECVKDCGSGFSNSDNGNCIPCSDPNCNDCKDNHLACNKCEVGFFCLHKNTCVVTCPEGYYDNVLSALCDKCNNCPKCQPLYVDNKSYCTECYDNFYLDYNGNCVTDCPDNQVKVGNECKNCADKNCKECSNTDVCDECMDGFKLYEGKCYSKCPSSTYEQGKECLNCNIKCAECVSEDNCTYCNETFYLQNNMCNETCANGYFKNDKLRTCDKCGDSERCIKCDLLNKNICLQCKSGFKLKEGSCVDNCEEGFIVLENSNGYYECVQCDDKNCLLCSTEDSSICLQCKQEFFLFELGKTTNCLNECPSGYIDVESKCTKCTNSLCEKCERSNLDICTSCISPYLLSSDEYIYDSNNNKSTNNLYGKCIENCEIGYVLDQETGMCNKCNVENCNNCSISDLSKCIDCKNDLFLYQGECLDKCPEGYVANSSDECIKCSSDNCKLCSITNLDMCYECQKGFLLKGTCYDICPLGYYGKNGNCYPCSSKCLECYDELNCFRCDVSYKLKEYNPYSSITEASKEVKLENTNIDLEIIEKKYYKCQNDCPVGSIVINDKCEKCLDSNCLICNNDLKTCNKCISPFILYNEECLKECPIGYYSNGYECSSCKDNCDSCDDNIVCNKCSEGYYLFNNNCLKSCPDYTYMSFENVSSCKYCTDSEKCLECNLENPNECYKCSSGILNNGICSDSCPPKTFLKEVNPDIVSSNNCEPCKNNCEICTNKENCNKCSPNYILFENNCLSECNKGYVLIENQCVKCGEGCLTCSSDNVDNCLSCYDKSSFLYNNRCYNECPESSYAVFDEIQNKCYDCNPKCLICSESADICSKCKEGFSIIEKKIDGNLPKTTCTDKCQENQVLIKGVCTDCKVENCSLCNSENAQICDLCKNDFYLFENKCLDKCPDYYYPDIQSNSCKKCNSACKVCTDESNNCEECANGFYFLSESKLCDKCNYPRILIDNLCYNCQAENCEKCSDNDYNVCSVCSKSFVLVNGKCQNNCPEGTYKNKTKDNENCLNCSDNCMSCENTEKCLKCYSQHFLLDNICVEKCPKGYGILEENNSKKCVKCQDINCNICQGSLPNLCIDCNSEYLINKISSNEAICLSSCEKGKFYNESNFNCENCINNCLECSNSDTCDKCELEYYLLNNTCVNTCPEGYYENSTVCSKCSTENCKTCPNNVCSECLSEFNIIKSNENVICSESCPSGYYGNEGICKKCGDLCLRCLNENTCTQCIGENLLLNGKCVSSCPDGYFLNNNSNTCEKCLSECSTCISNKPNSCIRCADNNVKLQSGECLNSKECPKYYYLNIEDYTCYPCNVERCATCTNENICTICDEGYKPNNTGNKCIETTGEINKIKNGIMLMSPNASLYYKINEQPLENKSDSTNFNLSKLGNNAAPINFGIDNNSSVFDTFKEDFSLPSKRLQVLFYLKSLGTTKNLKNTFSESIIFSYNINDNILAELIVSYEDTDVCYLRISNSLTKSTQKIGENINCSQSQLYNWNFFYISIILSNNNKASNTSELEVSLYKSSMKTPYNKVINVDSYVDYIINKSSSSQRNNLLSFVKESTLGSLGYHVYNISVANYRLDQETIANFESNTLSIPNNLWAENGTIILESNKTSLINTKEIIPKPININTTNKNLSYKLSDKIKNNVLTASHTEFGLNSYVFITNIPSSEDISIAKIYYPYSNYKIGEISALEVIASNKVKATESKAENGKVYIPIELLKSSNWYYIYVKINATLENVFYSVYLVDVNNNNSPLVYFKENIEAPLEVQNIVKLFIDASVQFGSSNINGQIYTPTIPLGNTQVFGDKSISENSTKLILSIEEITKVTNCAKFGLDFKCIECTENYILNSLENKCEDDALNNYIDYLSSIEVYGYNEKYVPISSKYKEEFSISFSLRKLVHSLNYSNTNIDSALLRAKVAGKDIDLITQSIIPNNKDNSSIKYLTTFTVGDKSKTFDLGDIIYKFTNVVLTFNNESKELNVYIHFDNNFIDVNNSSVSKENNPSISNDFKSNYFLMSTIKLKNYPTGLLFFDKKSAEINFEAVAGRLYPKFISESDVEKLLNVKLKETEPMCQDRNYFTGYCNKCLSKSYSDNACLTAFYGIIYTQVFDNESYEGSSYELKDEVKSTSLNSLYYVVTAKFNLYDFTNKDKNTEYNILNLKNDVHNFKDDDNIPKNPSDNLINLKAVPLEETPLGNDYEIILYLNNSVDTKRVNISTIHPDFKFSKGEWIFFSIGIDLRSNKINYYFSSDSNKASKTNINADFSLDHYSEKLQNKAKLILFKEKGQNNKNINYENSDIPIGEIAHSYIFPNPPDNFSLLISRFETDPQYLPKKVDNSSSESLIKNCKYASMKNNITVCFKCNDGFVVDSSTYTKCNPLSLIQLEKSFKTNNKLKNNLKK